MVYQCLRGSNRMFLLVGVEIHRGTDWIWRQLDDFESGNLFGNLGTDMLAWNCVCNRFSLFLCRSCVQEIKQAYQASVLSLFDDWIYRGRGLVRRTCKASTVVEMAYLMPVILLCWMLVVFALFYYHDKSVIAGAAYESVVVGSELWAEKTEYRSAVIEDYFRERIEGKLLFFRIIEVRIVVDQEKVSVEATAAKYWMTLRV